ncbi:DUF3718 domain-containing protein [Pseudoalteromonas sp. S1727]|uniref:DUF3718 domain-containing protein n=1 Tax=Pseudoalteromonas sp. S1727 TaxID=2066514 RepID=UPI00201661CF|nr:DUF3718 domain-containing protein [Pseudoalteromonas sp. S1727]
MMNTLTTTFCTTLLLGTAALTATNAEAAQFVAADNTPGTQICMAVASNKPIKLYLAMKEFRMNKSKTASKLQCNNMSMAEFTGTYGFDRTASRLGIDATTGTSIQDLAKLEQQTIMVVAGSK